MRAIALANALLLASCGNAFDPKLTPTFDRGPDGRAVVDAEGRYQIRITACVPGLDEARATITDLYAAGDGGATVTTTVVLRGPAPNTCPDGGLYAEAQLQAPDGGGTVRLEIAALGDRKVEDVEVAPPQRPATPTGEITMLALDPPSIPEGGGIVIAEITLSDASDEGAEDQVAVRTLPAVPIARRRDEQEDPGAGRIVAFVLAVPEDVADLWVEACLGDSCESSIARRVGR